MGVKPKAIALAIILAAGGCSSADLARLAPPGLIRYEDLSKGEPVDPQIAGRIEERKAMGKGRTPNLSEQPQEIPAGMPTQERLDKVAALRAQKEALEAAIAAERAAAEAERASMRQAPEAGRENVMSLKDTAEALARAVERDEAEAREERGLPPKPADDSEQ